MCNAACRRFVEEGLAEPEIHGRSVLEVGSRSINGSVRSYVESFEPARYVGVDVEAGPGVDELCDIADLVARFGENTIDVVVSTELMEHVRDWRSAFDQMKRVLRPDGLLVLTTRSIGFLFHAFPYDFWRYQVEDMRAIFADFVDVVVEADDVAPGVFVKARKPMDWSPVDVSDLALHSVVARRRVLEVSDAEVLRRNQDHWQNEAKRLVELKRENARLRKLLAEAQVEVATLKQETEGAAGIS